MPIRKDLPSTIARSDKHAQAIFSETHDSAVEQYGEGERAHRTAFASLKHSYKKEGDKWVPKAKKGPSDPQAVFGTREPRYPSGGGREVPLDEWPRDALYEYAKQLKIKGRSEMKKHDLIRAIQKIK
jgi:cation transport regulator ChaB